VEAKKYLRQASDNINNQELFSMNIESSESLIADIKERGLFLSDVAKIQDDIAILKKQFNGIETFEPTGDMFLYQSETPYQAVRVVDVSNKIYIVTSTNIIGPIIS